MLRLACARDTKGEIETVRRGEIHPFVSSSSLSLPLFLTILRLHLFRTLLRLHLELSSFRAIIRVQPTSPFLRSHRRSLLRPDVLLFLSLFFRRSFFPVNRILPVQESKVLESENRNIFCRGISGELRRENTRARSRYHDRT